MQPSHLNVTNGEDCLQKLIFLSQEKENYLKTKKKKVQSESISDEDLRVKRIIYICTFVGVLLLYQRT